MNENDMDRYFWRTGQRWSGDDDLPFKMDRPERKRANRTILILSATFAVTFAILLLLR